MDRLCRLLCRIFGHRWRYYYWPDNVPPWTAECDRCGVEE